MLEAAPLPLPELLRLITGSVQFDKPLWLSGAKLNGAKLYGAYLSRAWLTGADLRGADLRDIDLTGAKYSANTKWPEGFDPEAAGCKLVR